MLDQAQRSETNAERRVRIHRDRTPISRRMAERARQEGRSFAEIRRAHREGAEEELAEADAQGDLFKVSLFLAAIERDRKAIADARQREKMTSRIATRAAEAPNEPPPRARGFEMIAKRPRARRHRSACRRAGPSSDSDDSGGGHEPGEVS